MQIDHLADRFPAQLSGGQRQRVALGRALAIEPKVLLLDEPFGALDAAIRRDLRRWLRGVHDATGSTTIFVTHDQEEAFELADRVVVMGEGQIAQIGNADAIHDHPATPFVARIMETFLPCATQMNTTVRNRLGKIAEEISDREQSVPAVDAGAPSPPLTVFLDGAHIRCRPEYQKRHLDLVVGKIESPDRNRRFGFAQQAVRSPAKELRQHLCALGWNDHRPVTVISDREPALPNLVRSAVRGPVRHILDWWHISMRVQHVANAVKGLLQAENFPGMPELFKRPSETLRWCLWHGKIMTAGTRLQCLMIDCSRLSKEDAGVREAAARVWVRCRELYTYLANNWDALTNYGWRHRNGFPISSSRAEGCVDDIGNARMGKRRRMRWSPKGAHRVAVTRAAVLDGRLTVSHRKLAV